jgi:probable rRNA maturation factor
MPILISNEQTSHQIAINKLEKAAQIILNDLGCPNDELSLVISSDDQIAELNRQYLKRTGPTNVIAFPMREGPFSEVTPQLLGDIVISADTTAREARQAGSSFETRLLELLIHGILHLCGYDHEKTETEAKRMESRSQKLFALLQHAGIV